jgi:hypothetical protein
MRVLAVSLRQQAGITGAQRPGLFTTGQCSARRLTKRASKLLASRRRHPHTRTFPSCRSART